MDNSYAAVIGTSLVVGVTNSTIVNDVPNTAVSGGTLLVTLDPNSIGVMISGPRAPSKPLSSASSVFSNFNVATPGGFKLVPVAGETVGGWTHTVPHSIQCVFFISCWREGGRERAREREIEKRDGGENRAPLSFSPTLARAFFCLLFPNTFCFVPHPPLRSPFVLLSTTPTKKQVHAAR